MIGVSAVLAGVVRLPPETLVLEGAAGILVLLAGAGVLLGVVPPVAAEFSVWGPPQLSVPRLRETPETWVAPL